MAKESRSQQIRSVLNKITGLAGVNCPFPHLPELGLSVQVPPKLSILLSTGRSHKYRSKMLLGKTMSYGDIKVAMTAIHSALPKIDI